MTDVPPEKTPEEWIPITKAVGITGKSERTIRRYIEIGRLSSRQEKGRLLVKLADLLPPTPPPPPEPPVTTERLQADVTRLQAEIDKLQSLLQATEADRDYLRQALAAALASQQKLIEATATAPARPRRWRWPWDREKDNG